MSRHLAILFSLVAACATDPTDDPEQTSDTTQESVIPSGPYTDWAFASDLWNLDTHTVVTTAPPAAATEFWATQFWFRNGNGGYMGIQNAGELPGGGSGKIAIASIWDATGAQPAPGAVCFRFSEGGTGFTCRRAYNWVPGHTYRNRVWAVGSNRWVYAIADLNTGVEYQLGVIDNPGSWGYIDKDDIINWTEYFSANSVLPPSCAAIPLAAATFSLYGDDNTLAPRLLQAHVANASCHNTVEKLVAPTAVNQSFGGPVNSWLAQGQSLAPGQGIRSPDGQTLFVHQTDGNVVVYHGSRALWASRTNGHATRTLAMQTDGNLVLYSSTNAPLWYTRTNGRVITSLIVQNDCNVVLYQNGAPIWATGTNGCVSRL